MIQLELDLCNTVPVNLRGNEIILKHVGKKKDQTENRVFELVVIWLD